MKKLAILGASYLQLPLVLKAKEMGIETHCFAWDNEEAVCKNSTDFFYPISVLDKVLIHAECARIGIDGITTIATDICIPTISFVAEKLGLPSNSYQTALNATNKALMRETFAKHNINSPRFLGVETYQRQDFEHFDFPLIVKPTDRSGSRGVTKVYDQSQLENAIAEAVLESLEKKAIVEEFIEGAEISVECISHKGQHFLLAVTDKVTTGEPHFVELQHHQPSQLPKPILEAVMEITFNALNALGIAFGASHSEFKINADGRIVAIEIGARMGGDFIGSHLTPLSTGYDFMKGVIDVALEQFNNPILSEQHFSGVYFLAKETENLLPYFQKINAFDIENTILKSKLEHVKSSGDRSGFLIYQSEHKVIL
jgi:biotin carboxylase